jgi:antitoxin component YwqK of YwqJK toxin-antitoxin module
MHFIQNWALRSAVLFLFFLSGCAPSKKTLSQARVEAKKNILSSITLVDKNGVTETIAEKERLLLFEKTDFFSPQPYQKVLRVYARGNDGKIHSKLSTYHDNGSIKQYLEINNGRAMGRYKEWFSSGQVRIEATVIEGKPEVDPLSQETWSFDGESMVYAEDGSLEATFNYHLGVLEGESKQFFRSGSLKRIVYFKKGVQVGEEKLFFESGEKRARKNYDDGKLNGESIGWYQDGHEQFKEQWLHGLLMEGSYYDKTGKLVACVENGNGKKARFSKGLLSELIEIRNGAEEGEVRLYSVTGDILSLYCQKDGLKHGLEIRYFPKSKPLKPKMSIEWQEGVVNGTVKTWYPSGKLESQREFISNAKQGISMAWYIDGSVMLIEEYEKERLMRGEYRKRGDSHPVSKIVDGKGYATLFDAKGALLKKVRYVDGYPQTE